MDIVWILCEVCVEIKIHGLFQSFKALKASFKASLRICYVSLFECKDPWMLKIVINCRVWNRRLQN